MNTPVEHEPRFSGGAVSAAGDGSPDPRRQIVATVRAIPEGFVRTYGDVWPPAPRLTGRVLATAHAPELPWWRVVRSDGSLAAGERQRALLEAEAVPFRRGGRVDLRLARLPPGLG